MPAELVINVTSQETRIALIENGLLAELFIERQSEKGIGGNIYKGKVVRVLPGMQAAFVDIGLARSAFLYVSDVYEDFDDLAWMMGASGEDGDFAVERNTLVASRYSSQIEDMLNDGQEVLVQVSKEPIGSKGARVTAHISLPGHYLVLMPTVDHIGVSRRIENEGERKKLREIISRIKPPGVGFIVRTASEGRTEEDLLMDMDFLLKLWEKIQLRRVNAPVCSIIHSDLDICLRAIRDLYTKDVEKVVVDSEKEYNEIVEFIDRILPSR
jgi:ribonuclease G